MTKLLIILGIIPVFLWSGGGFLAVMLWILAWGVVLSGWELSRPHFLELPDLLRKVTNRLRNLPM